MPELVLHKWHFWFHLFYFFCAAPRSSNSFFFTVWQANILLSQPLLDVHIFSKTEPQESQRLKHNCPQASSRTTWGQNSIDMAGYSPKTCLFNLDETSFYTVNGNVPCLWYGQVGDRRASLLSSPLSSLFNLLLLRTMECPRHCKNPIWSPRITGSSSIKHY